MENQKLKICFWPGREQGYIRCQVLLKGLRDAGCLIYDCSYSKKSYLRYLIGFWNFLKFKGKSDIILIGFLGHGLVPIAKCFTRKPIIFDAFLSIYQTLSEDRKKIKPNGLLASLVRWFEKKSCQLSDRVLLDTNQHIDYFVTEYDLNPEKFKRSLVGCNSSNLQTQSTKTLNQNFYVHFYGEFQPLHGTDYIVQAARQLPNIQFKLLGSGQELSRTRNIAKKYNIQNVEFIPRIPYNELSNFINSADLCIGIVGNTHKTQMVIPCKVYEQTALRKPIITADTPAIRELFEHKENIYLCKAANPVSLANGIEELYNSPELRTKIAENGYKVFSKHCSPKKIGEEIKNIAQELLQS